MDAGNCLTTASVLDAFSEEIADHGGSVNDAFNDGERLFVRSILPEIQEVATNDRLQGGVALKAYGGEVWVHPYVFRLVCRNGAIMAQTVTSRRVTAHFDWNEEEVVVNVREAVRACCVPEVFTSSSQQIRSTREVEADHALQLLPLLTSMRGAISSQMLQEILKRFFDDGDQTQFGLMNAVTSTARDTADPQMRWDLEELGGGIAIVSPAPIPRMPSRSATRQSRVALVS
jgi:hypothetical protein